ncbi:MAG: Rad52/Rad22 family DNA repair protein [Blastocatellia bacterium]
MSSNNTSQIQPAPSVSEPTPLRSIRAIISDLSKPVNAQRLKVRTEERRNKRTGETTKIELRYIPWYQAVRYLDNYAPGWRYEIRSVNQIGASLVMVARIIIPCAEGEAWREASALEPIEGNGFGDPATNAESAALRRAAAKFGLCLNLYDK